MVIRQELWNLKVLNNNLSHSDMLEEQSQSKTNNKTIEIFLPQIPSSDINLLMRSSCELNTSHEAQNSSIIKMRNKT